MSTLRRCPICQFTPSVIRSDLDGTVRIACEPCGTYTNSFRAQDKAELEWSRQFQEPGTSTESLAIVACDGSGNGCILFYSGEPLVIEIEEHGFRTLLELKLDDAPFGISVWSGRYRYTEDDAFPSGTFRPLTALEADCLRVGQAFWTSGRIHGVTYGG